MDEKQYEILISELANIKETMKSEHEQLTELQKEIAQQKEQGQPQMQSQQVPQMPNQQVPQMPNQQVQQMPNQQVQQMQGQQMPQIPNQQMQQQQSVPPQQPMQPQGQFVPQPGMPPQGQWQPDPQKQPSVPVNSPIPQQGFQQHTQGMQPQQQMQNQSQFYQQMPNQQMQNQSQFYQQMPNQQMQNQSQFYQQMPNQQRQNQPQFYQQMPGGPSIPNAPYSSQRAPGGTAGKISVERTIGKYIIGVLASLLIFVACGILIYSYWDAIGDVAKAAGLLGFGCLVLAVGYFLIIKKEKTPFSYSVTACGLGIIYFAIIASNMIWNLVPSLVVLLGIGVWIGLCIYLARLCHSRLFFYIIGIGNAITALLLIFVFIGGVQDLIALLFMIAAETVLLVCYQKEYHTSSLALLGLLTWTAFCMLGSILDTQQPGLLRDALGTAQIFVFTEELIYLISTGILLYAFTRFLEEKKKIWEKVIVVIFLLGVLIMDIFMVWSVVEFFASGSMETIATCLLLLLFLIPLLWNKQTRGLVLVLVTLFLMADLGVLSDELFAQSFWLIAPYTVITLVIYKLDQKLWTCIHSIAFETIVWFGYLLLAGTGNWRMGGPERAMIIALLLSILIYAVMEFVSKYKKETWDGRDLAFVILTRLSIFFALLLFAVYANERGSWVIYLLIAYGFSFGCGLLTKKRSKAVYGMQIGEAVFLNLVIMLVLSGTEFGLFTALGIILLLLTGTVFLYQMMEIKTVENRRIFVIIAAVLVTINLLRAASVTVLWEYAIAVSLLCLVAAVGFIVAGFIRKQKELRSYGLILLIICVIKMVTWDVASGSIPMRIAALVAGGILCFGISFAYNYIEKKDKRRDGKNEN